MRWAVRLVLLAALAVTGVRAGTGLPYEVAGHGLTGDVVLSFALTAPPLAVAAVVAGFLRRMPHPAMPWVGLGIDVAQTIWAALVADLYTLANLWSGGEVGWNVGVRTFGIAGVLLLGAWTLEDRLAHPA